MDFNPGPMAKNVPHKKRKQKDLQPVKQRHTIQFLFPSPGTNQRPQGYLSEFAGRIKTEHASRSGIICLHPVGTPSGEENPMVRFLSPDARESEVFHDIFKEGYVVILESQPLERQINPNEFFQLALPEDQQQLIFHEVSFKSKKTVKQAGLIVPADALIYLLTVAGIDASLNTGSIKLVLKKLGFEKKEVVIHQDAPFETVRSQGPFLWERIKFGLAWNTILPVKEALEPSLRKLFFTREHPLFRLAFFITALAIFIIVPILSLDAGLSGDDEKHYNHAVKVYRYFKFSAISSFKFDDAIDLGN